MTLELQAGRIAVLFSFDEARSLRQYFRLAGPKDLSDAGIQRWHEANKVTQSLVLRLASVLDPVLSAPAVLP